MKKYLTISIIVNLFFILMFGYVVHRKGGINYVKRKLGIETTNQSQTVVQTGNKFSTYWNYRKSIFEVLPNNPNEIIFLGNSITDGCEWSELFNNESIINRGIGGDGTEGIISRLPEITESKPKKIFIMIGINDLGGNSSTDIITTNYRSILRQIRTDSPETNIYVQSVLPVRDPIKINNDTIILLNDKLKSLSEEMSLTYINLFDSFKDDNGFLKSELTNDGIHLMGQGYILWKSLIEEFVNN